MIKTYKLTLFLILLVLVALPRFNWRELPHPLNKFVGIKPFDIEQYEIYVKYFRGEKKLADQLEGPFSYRPFVPFVASFLPFDPLTSINITNLIFVSIGLIFLIKLLIKLEFNDREITIGSLIFIFSFPLFYYTTSGYIDASLIGIMLISNYFLFTNRYFIFIMSFIIGILIKETILILLPVLIVYYLFNDEIKNRILKIIIPIIIYILLYGLIRNFAPQKETFVWVPSLEIIKDNLIRIKTYLTFLLTFGIPGLLSLVVAVHKVRKNIPSKIFYSLITGLIFSFLLWFYSLFAAYSDGRQLWTSYIFTIPLSAYLFRLNRKIKIK